MSWLLTTTEGVPQDSRLMTTDPPPNGAASAYADEGDANLDAFISCPLGS